MAGFHQSLYSGAAHIVDSGIISARRFWSPLLAEAGVDVVLQEHDHVYSRTAFVNGLCETLNDYPYSSGSVVSNPEGTLYITCSTSSGCLYHEPDSEIRIVKQGQPYTPMALRFDVTDTELRLRAYLVDSWTVYDEYTIRKE